MKNFSFYCIVAICFAFIAFSVTGCDIETEPNEENGGKPGEKSQYSSFNLEFQMACNAKVTMDHSKDFYVAGTVGNDSHLQLYEASKKFTKIFTNIKGTEYIYEHIAKHIYKGMPVGDYDTTKYVVKIFIDTNNIAKLEYYEKRDRKAGDRKDEHIVELKCGQIPFTEIKWGRFLYHRTDIPASKIDYFFAQNKTSQQTKVETHELVEEGLYPTHTSWIYLYLDE